MKGLFLRVKEETIKRLEEIAQKENKTKAEIIESLIENYHQIVKSEKLEKEEIEKLTWSKPLPLKFPKVCIKCKRKLEVGELVLISKTKEGYVYLCYQCYLNANLNRIPEVKKIFKYYKELQKVRSMYNIAKSELDRIVNKINIYEVYDHLEYILDELKTTIFDIQDYLRKVESNEKLIKILEKLEEIERRVEKATDFIILYFKKKRKKKEVYA